MQTLRIGVTQCSKTPQYINWLKDGEKFGYQLECIELPFKGSPTDVLLKQNLDALNHLDAIVFTGGEDVEPKRFGVILSPEELSYFDIVSEPERDEIEWALAEASLERRLPIFGICRGMQLINVVMGGTLYLDIDKQGASAQTHKKFDAEHSRYHAVTLEKNSLLYELIGETHTDFVGSRHHQGVEKIGHGLKPVAYSPDGIIEALESSAPEQTILLVQWHPERMWLEAQRDHRPEFNNAFSENLLKGFLSLLSEKKVQPA
ncbi:MAG: gamma-glutamyl-gamma-aminobutyrate hydrolase family protein [Candidatus Thermochlorobacter sp.]